MKRPPDKSDLRRELEAATKQYLRGGGHVTEVPQGRSAYHDNVPPPYLTDRVFTKPKQSRTPVPEVVAAIEARRGNKKTAVKRRTKKPQSKVLYDDFGEPLRHVWVDE